MRVGEEYQAVVPDLITGKWLWILFNCLEFFPPTLRGLNSEMSVATRMQNFALKHFDFIVCFKFTFFSGKSCLNVTVKAKFRLYLEIE
jgi:hypothetical protein